MLMAIGVRIKKKDKCILWFISSWSPSCKWQKEKPN